MPHSIVLYDNADWRKHFFPFTASRPVGNLRVGLCTLNEKWNKLFHCPVSYHTAEYLQLSFPLHPSPAADILILDARLLPSEVLLQALDSLKLGEVLMDGSRWLAARVDRYPDQLEKELRQLKPIQLSFSPSCIHFPEDIFRYNKEQLLADFKLLTKGRNSASLSSSNALYGDWLFVEEGAQLEGVSLNSLKGPIYIGKNAQLEEGCFLKGYVGIGANARVKTGARLYENVSIGPGNTIAGEVNNTVMWGNSAKGHEGYLGCAVIGEGCNLGAGSSNSNLKNNWKAVKLYDYKEENLRDTGLLKCGLMMGDYAMAAINSSFTTGTVIGCAAQIAISNFIPKFVPDFCWLTDQQKEAYILEEFFGMLARRKQAGAADNLHDMAIFNHIFAETKEIRDRIINT